MPGLPLKRYHKISKLVQRYSTQHAFYPSESNIRLSTQELNQNMDIANDNMHFHRILELDDREHIWITSIFCKISPKMLEWLRKT